MRVKLPTAILILVPLLAMLWIWLSPLAFVPVPWPDDSAFYFVGREFFKWPPRWVMLPQAPFEPTYRIYNFNTMPLYPMIVGLGRLIGIDGSHAIKLWPLAAYGLSGSLLSAWLYSAGLPFVGALLIALTFSLDPGMRWASVLVRPESLIGLMGVALVMGLSLGFPARLRPRGLWHPVSALLALAAYAHFNAIHLLFPVVLAYIGAPLELMAVGLRCVLYLVPWLVTVAIHPLLFAYQMRVQWTRLQYHSDWLSTPAKALKGIFQDMGSPEPWPDNLRLVAYVIWGLMIAALIFGLVIPLGRVAIQIARKQESEFMPESSTPRLLPAASWILGSVWLWQSKPEVWFNYYVHISVWTFAGLAMLAAWKQGWSGTWPRLAALASVCAALAFSTAIFGYVDVAQAARLGDSPTWHWATYREWVGCIDRELMSVEARLGNPKPFRVWGPTFPDITIELSRLHPDWEFTRTNDFWDRAHLAVQHGRDVEAVVVTEMLNWQEREVSAPQSQYPDIQSVWMTWDQHFLNRLWKEAGWKPNRYLCQKGRWQGFIFEK